MQKIGSAKPERRVASLIQLSRPLVGHNGNIDSIELREPTIGDWVDCGPIMRRIALDPRENEGRNRVEILEDPEAVMRWMLRLSGHPEALLRTLCLRDGRAVAGEVLSLVTEVESGNSSPQPTTSHSAAA